MTHFDEVFRRIKQATGTRTQVELAEVLDIRQSSISDAKRRNSVPADWYMKLFEQYGLNPDWLKKEIGPMYLRTELNYTPVDAPANGNVNEEAARYGSGDAKNMVVPVYSAQCADAAQCSPAALNRLSIPQSFALPGLQVLKVDNSGMEPQIRKGAFVGLDTTLSRVASGELYGVRLPYEGLVLRRAFIDAQNDKLILRADNASLPEVSLPLEGHEAHILGRVIWVMQRL